MPAPDLSLIREFKRRAEAALPGRIARFVLHGARDRGDAREDSDGDVAVFTLQVPRPGDRSDLRVIAFDPLAETGSVTGVVPLSLRRADDGPTTAVGVTADGIAI